MANLIEKVTKQQWTSKPINKFLYLQSKPVTSSLYLSQARHRVRQQTEKTGRKGINRAVSNNSTGNLWKSDSGWITLPHPLIIQTGLLTFGSSWGPSLRFNVRCFLNGGCLVIQLSSRLWQSPKEGNFVYRVTTSLLLCQQSHCMLREKNPVDSSFVSSYIGTIFSLLFVSMNDF